MLNTEITMEVPLSISYEYTPQDNGRFDCPPRFEDVEIKEIRIGNARVELDCLPADLCDTLKDLVLDEHHGDVERAQMITRDVDREDDDE
jgi:hypothetical protein